MKNYLTYGLAMAVAGALLTLALYFLGFHSDAAKMNSAQWVALPLIIAICVGCIVMGTKARRAEIPATEPFGYGRAFVAGLAIVFFGALFGIITNALYFGVINPGFSDILAEAQLAKLEAKGVTGAALDRAEQGMRFMMKPAMMTVFGFINAMVFGTIIALITAAFLKRPASAEPPPMSA